MSVAQHTPAHRRGESLRGTAAQIHASLLPVAKPVRAPTVKRRRELVEAQIEALSRAIVDIRRKARETPAWAHGYDSAVTTIELQIDALRAGKTGGVA